MCEGERGDDGDLCFDSYSVSHCLHTPYLTKDICTRTVGFHRALLSSQVLNCASFIKDEASGCYANRAAEVSDSRDCWIQRKDYVVIRFQVTMYNAMLVQERVSAVPKIISTVAERFYPRKGVIHCC